MVSIQKPGSKDNDNGYQMPPSDELLAGLPIAVYTCDKYGYILTFNQAAVDLWGRRPEIGRDLWCGSLKIFRPTGEQMPLDDCPMARTLKTATAINGERIIIQRPDGRRILVKVYPKPLFDNNGALIGAVNTLVDIREQQTYDEEKLMLGTIIESAEVPIISKNIKGIITSWNKAAEQLFGYNRDEVIGKSITILIPNDRLIEEEMILGKIRRNGRVEHYETVRLTKQQKLVPVSLTISPIKNVLGQIVGASKIIIDITRQKEYENKLKQYTDNIEILNTMGKLISESLDTEAILQKVTDASTQIIGAEFGAFFYNKIDDDGESYMLFTFSGAPREAFEKFGLPRNTAVFHPTFSGQGTVRDGNITKDPRFGKNSPHHDMAKGHLPIVSYLAVSVFSKSGEVVGGLFYGHPEPDKFTQEHENLIESIAAQTAMALENAKLYVEVQQLNKKKDEFIGLASHELKTPVTSLKGYLQIIDKKLTDDNNRSFVSKAVRQVDKLSSLIADLLDISKIESGQLALSYSHFDLITVAQDIIEFHQYMAKNHHIIFESSTDSLMVFADQQRIEQVINNLLSNAIKYCPHAEKVIVSVAKLNNAAIVKVQDFGMGISKDQQKRIFSRFYRVEETATHISGLGIGLYISKQIIDRHNGKLTVESEPGQGSLFSFEIPVSK